MSSIRNASKWLGAAMVVFGIVCFPFAIWFPGPWGVLSLVLIIVGCFLLVAAMKGAQQMADTHLPPDGDPPPAA